ncbi:MAG: hypothetical protein H0T48_02210 [Gemmatimonadaceae bacterium]|nr:hypothetical protein [Gemmatimonadaceae bacterium]
MLIIGLSGNSGKCSSDLEEEAPVIAEAISPYAIDQGANACADRIRADDVYDLLLARLNKVRARLIPADLVKNLSLSAARLAPAFLLLACINCGGGETTEPSVATTLAANSSTSVIGVAGAVVAPPPSVIVKDQNGSPMGGATVTFAVVSGGGSVSEATVTTNASGIATVGSWTLGPVTGANVLNATSGTLNGVAFTATSTAGAAASLARNAGDNQTGAAGSVVAIPPSVLVKDANGNPKSDVSVTFAVVSGGGSITGATAVTNAAGVAIVGSWTLGNSPGVNSLSATVTGLPSVTFIAGASSNFCTVRSTHTFGTSSSGTISSNDCQFSDGSFVDFYTTSVPQAGAYLFRESAVFDTYLLLAMPDGTTIGENDDELETGTNSGIKALLPAGNYLLSPGTFAPGVTGDYTISSTTAPTDVANCEQVFVVKNITTMQNIATTDCNLANAAATPIYSDGYFIFLTAGTPITINMTSTALDSFLQLVRLDGLVMAENDNIDATTKDSRITFTVTQTNYYAIFTRSVPTTAVGAYTLTIQ